MSFDLIYKAVTKGAMTFTGNTQGLSKLYDESAKGTSGNIGAFISLDQSLEASDFGLGTTFDYTKNGSYAYLDIPENSTILFAYLTWAGTYSYNIIDIISKDMSTEKDYPIIFNLSNGDSVNLSYKTQKNEDILVYVGEELFSTIKKYTNSIDVTEYVKQSGGGKYSVEQIPALLEVMDGYTSSSITAGWTLSVIYENENLPERTMCLWTGLEAVNDSSVEVSLDGFQTSKVSDVSARLLVSACEGDNDITDDVLEFGENSDNLTVISGVNNPANNFFCSQINNDLGELDTRGSFGDVNHNPITGENTIGARQGWDITNVDISNIIKNNQKNALIKLSTNGDAYSVNAVGLQIDTPQMTTEFIKTVDKITAKVGDTLTYTATITNTGLDNLVNVIFTDLDLPNTTFIEGSVLVNGVLFSKANPNDGFSIGALDKGDSTTVIFSVIVTSNTDKIAINIATIEKENEQSLIIDQYSNEVETMILNAEISEIVKSVDKTEFTLGDILTYYAEFNNTGDFTLISVVLTDKTTDGVAFVENSLVINEKEYTNEDITKGVKLSDISSGEKISLSFKMEVIADDIDSITDTLVLDYSYLLESETLVSETVFSNEVTVYLEDSTKASIEVVKSGDKEIAVLGDTINYSFKVSNTGNVDLFSVDLTDLLDQNLAFVEGSVMIDGVLDINQNPTSQIIIGDLAVDTSIIVSFDTLVVNNIGETIENQATVTANYTTKDGLIKAVGAFSNIYAIKLRFPMLEITKSADVSSVSLGDTIHYSVILENTGDTDLYEVLFQDYLPSTVEFVEGSFVLNGEVVNSVDLLQGVLIGIIKSSETFYIEYDALAISGSCNKKITNKAQAFYSYQYESEELQTGQTEIASVTISAEVSNFKQISLNSKVCVPSVKPDMKTLDNTVASIDIVNFYVVDVISGISNEGQRLYGKKLIIHGNVNASIEYTEPCDKVHSAHWTIPFTTYIVLPKDYTDNRKISVTAMIENVSSEAINCRDLEINTLALVVATIAI